MNSCCKQPGVRTKGRAREKAKGKTKKVAVQCSQAVYFGDPEGNVICTLAYGDAVKNIPPRNALNVLLNVSSLRTRPGQVGVLVWSDDTQLSRNMEENDTSMTPAFPYDTSSTCKDFATLGFVQEMKFGDYVALVIKLLEVETKTTADKGEPYLLITGVDTENAVVGHLRLWRFEESDVVEGNVYIVRGLKVAAETSWDEGKWKYVPHEDGTKKAECKDRTAMVDVTHVEEIVQFSIDE